jgi:hypothetical protein
VSGKKVPHTRLLQNGTSGGVLPLVRSIRFLCLSHNTHTSPCIGLDVGRVNMDIRTAEFRNPVRTWRFVDVS